MNYFYCNIHIMYVPGIKVYVNHLFCIKFFFYYYKWSEIYMLYTQNYVVSALECSCSNSGLLGISQNTGFF